MPCTRGQAPGRPAPSPTQQPPPPPQASAEVVTGPTSGKSAVVMGKGGWEGGMVARRARRRRGRCGGAPRLGVGGSCGGLCRGISLHFREPPPPQPHCYPTPTPTPAAASTSTSASPSARYNSVDCSARSANSASGLLKALALRLLDCSSQLHASASGSTLHATSMAAQRVRLSC